MTESLFAHAPKSGKYHYFMRLNAIYQNYTNDWVIVRLGTYRRCRSVLKIAIFMRQEWAPKTCKKSRNVL